MDRREWSINKKFTLFILMATVSFLVLIYLISYEMLRSFSQDTVEEVAITILDGTDSRIRSLFQDFESLALGLAGTRAVKSADPEGMKELFISSVLAWKHYIRAIYLGTAEGDMYEWGHGAEFVDYTPSFPPGYDPRQRPWYREALENEGFGISPPYKYASVDALGITCVVPVHDDEGRFVGVLGMDILLENLKTILEDLNIPKRGKAFILGEDGLLIAGEDGLGSGADLPLRRLGGSDLPDLSTKPEGKFETRYRNVDMQFYYRHSTPVNWFLLVGIPKDSIMASAVQVLRLISIMELFIMGLLIIALNLISNRLIANPLHRIVSVINRIEGGERTARVSIQSRDEFGLLGREFNKLVDTVEEYSVSLETKVRERTEKLRRLQKENTRLRIAEERKRIYRDMHDSLGAKLTNIFFCNSVARSALERDPEKLEELFGSIESNCLKAVQALKTIVGGMKEREGGGDGFLPELAADMRRRLRLQRIALLWRSKSADSQCTLDIGTQRELERVFDELVSNVLKHSGATRVLLSCGSGKGDLRIRFKDNGKGFDKAEAEGRGSGLGNIRYRIESLGGRMELDSRPGKGTEYCFILPSAESRA